MNPNGLIRTKINEILIQWDPIGVKGHSDIENEYTRYIDEIVSVMEDLEKLKALIYDIEDNRIGFFYTSDSEKKKVIESIYKLNLYGLQPTRTTEWP